MITPFLNAERFLEEAIKSVLAQNFDAWELLLIDDGSTDGSTSIAQRYARQYSDRIRYLHHEGRRSRGASAARNLGLVHARGEYIAILDADDIAEPERFEKQVAYLDAHPEVALVGSWYTEIDSAGRRLGAGRKPCRDLDIRWAMLFYCPFLHSSVMFRKAQVLEQVGGYDESLPTSQDFELWTRIPRSLTLANLGVYLVRYRLHESSLTSTRGGQAQIGHRMRVERVSRLLGWDGEGFALREHRLDVMSRLLVGISADYGTEFLDAAVDDMFRLHAAFCHETGLTAAEAARHRAQLRAQLSENLVVLAATCGLRQHGKARKLLRCAYRLHWPVFFRGRTVARSCRRVIHRLVARPQAVSGS